jgi:transposase InsO family protein
MRGLVDARRSEGRPGGRRPGHGRHTAQARTGGGTSVRSRRQWASLAFGATLRDSGVLASMGSRGDAYDNAAAESFMATIKKELIYRNRFKSRNAARLAIFDYVERLYNPLRRHSTLGQKSPIDYELTAARVGS